MSTNEVYVFVPTSNFTTHSSFYTIWTLWWALDICCFGIVEHEVIHLKAPWLQVGFVKNFETRCWEFTKCAMPWGLISLFVFCSCADHKLSLGLLQLSCLAQRQPRQFLLCFFIHLLTLSSSTTRKRCATAANGNPKPTSTSTWHCAFINIRGHLHVLDSCFFELCWFHVKVATSFPSLPTSVAAFCMNEKMT